MVGQDEPAGAFDGALPDVGLQVAELRGVDVDVRVETDERRPVPARPDGEDRVERRRRLVVLAEGEQAEGPELVDRGVVGQLHSAWSVSARAPA